MTNMQIMTRAQREDLLIEWNLYSPGQRQSILDEFHKLHNEDYTQNDFLLFLRQKLEINADRKKAIFS